MLLHAKKEGMNAEDSNIILNAHAHVCDYRVCERGAHGYADDAHCDHVHSIDYCGCIAMPSIISFFYKVNLTKIY